MEGASPKSPSSERSLAKRLLRSGRHSRGLVPASTTSSLSSVDGQPHDGSSSIRMSLDRGMEKLKDYTRPNHHHTESPRRNSVDPSPKSHKLMSSLSLRKKVKNPLPNVDDGSDVEVARGRSTVLRMETAGTNRSRLSIVSGNATPASLPRSHSGGSSLLTEDSDIDDSLVRPGLITHPSHAGYLTLTSPLINAETVKLSEIITEEVVTAARSAGSPDSFQSLVVPTVTQDGGTSTSEHDSLATQHLQALRADNIIAPAPGLSLVIEDKRNLEDNDPAIDEPAVHPSPLKKVVSISTSGRSPPLTVITPPTPVVAATGSPGKRFAASNLSLGPLPPPTPSDDRVVKVPGIAGITQRRIRSGTTSSRSNQIISPLSPTVEEAKTPGGSLTHSSASGGFFSSVFSSAQNAVSTLSSTFSGSSHVPGQRSRSGTAELENIGPVGDEEVIETNPNKSAIADTTPREPAVATLGSGDLSLEQLGILEIAVNEPMANIVQTTNRSPRGSNASLRYDDAIAARAAIVGTTMQSEKSNGDRNITPIVNDTSGNGRSRSIASTNIGSVNGEITPPRATAELDYGSIGRSASVRSHISTKVKRHRRSSAAAGSTIAAALGSSHATLALPPGAPNGPKSTGGFPLASSKRNKDFHQLFRSVPESDQLIEDWSAALQRDILLQGRFYVSEKHICFSSNIMGWVTNLVISFDEVLSMEKKTTAMLFHNGIAIQTLHTRNVFATFLSRDTTYDLVLAVWKVGHRLKLSEHGHVLDESSGEVKFQRSDSNDTTQDSDDDESGSYSEDDDNETAGSFIDAGGSVAGSDVGETLRANQQRSPSLVPITMSIAHQGHKENEAHDGGTGGAGGTQEFPGPTTHVPTECSDQASHYEKRVMDAIIPAPLGKVFSMMFGATSGQVMRKFLLEDQKSEDLQLENDKRGMGDDRKQFSYSFIKQLGGSIGPKQTKCLVSQTLDVLDLERAACVTCSTQTPDVPSGNSFVTKTKYCLMWGPGNSTRFLMSSTVEWSAKSWLKGPIEKGANDGQIQYGKDIVAFFKAQVATKSPQRGVNNDKGRRGKKRRATNDDNATGTMHDGTPETRGAKQSHPEKSLWGPLEPVRSVLVAFLDIVGSRMNAVTVLGALLAIFVSLYLRAIWRPLANMDASVSFGGLNAPRRLAAYEQMWRREESELWTWLEDRVKLEAIVAGSGVDRENEAGSRRARQQVLQTREFAAKLQDEAMSERDIDEAISITSERLEALKAAVKAKKSKVGA